MCVRGDGNEDEVPPRTSSSSGYLDTTVNTTVCVKATWRHGPAYSSLSSQRQPLGLPRPRPFTETLSHGSVSVGAEALAF